MRLDVRGDAKAVMRDIDKLSKREMPRVMVQALNRTGNRITSDIAKTVAKREKVKVRSVRNRIPRRKANKRNMEYRFFTFTQPIPVHSQLTSAQLASSLKTRRARAQTKKGVRYRGTVFPGSFVATPRAGGKPVVIKRKGASRYPTTTVGINVKRTFDVVSKRMVRTQGRKLFKKNFEQRARYILARRR